MENPSIKNPIVKITQACEGTRWVIGDIHGCPKTFRHLVHEKIQLKKEDHLFLLGDYIDRGADSGGVIDYILELQDQAYQVFPLRGNHEDMLLEAYDEYDSDRLFYGLLRLQKCRGVTDENGIIRSHYIDFMRTLPYCFELPDYYLVHAGMNFKEEKPFEDYKSMLWIRDFEVNPKVLGAKRLVRGHVPTSMTIIQERIRAGHPVIPLDNGCVYRFRKRKAIYDGLGSLCALNLDNSELLSVENIDDDPAMLPPPFFPKIEND